MTTMYTRITLSFCCLALATATLGMESSEKRYTPKQIIERMHQRLRSALDNDGTGNSRNA